MIKDTTTGIYKLEANDTDISEILEAEYVAPQTPTGPATLGILDAWRKFIDAYAVNPFNILEGFDFTGTPASTGTVKVDIDDLAGYLEDKLQAAADAGVTLTESGTTNKVLNLGLNIGEADTSGQGLSLLETPKSVKRVIAGDNMSISSEGGLLNFSANFDNLKFEDLANTPSTLTGTAGKKWVTNDTEDGLVPLPSTTSSGFYTVTPDTMTHDPLTNTLTLTGTNKFVTSNYSEYEKTDDAFVYSVVGDPLLIYIYYDDAGALQQYNNPSVTEQYELMLTTLPVAYILYNSTLGFATFVGDYRKPRVSSGLWVKNFYDQQIYALGGGLFFTDLVLNVDSDAAMKFGLSSGHLVFAGNIYDVPTRASSDVWNVGYFNGSTLVEPYGIQAHTYFVLNDVTLGIGATGRVVYNNNGTPTVVSDNYNVWYFVVITNDITDTDRTLSIMGNSQYSSATAADDGLGADIAYIEGTLQIKQGARVVKAILVNTKNTYSGENKAQIIKTVEVTRSDISTSGSISIPDLLINGGDATSLHNHDSKYLKLIGGTMEGDIDMGSNAISNISNLTATGIINIGAEDEAKITILPASKNISLVSNDTRFITSTNNLKTSITTDGVKVFNGAKFDANSSNVIGLIAGTATGHAVEYDQLNTALGGYLPKTAGSGESLTGTLYGTSINMSDSVNAKYATLSGEAGATGHTETLLNIGTSANVYSATAILKIAGYVNDVGGGYIKAVRPSEGTASQNNLIIGTNNVDLIELTRTGSVNILSDLTVTGSISSPSGEISFSDDDLVNVGTITASPATLDTHLITKGQVYTKTESNTNYIKATGETRDITTTGGLTFGNNHTLTDSGTYLELKNTTSEARINLHDDGDVYVRATDTMQIISDEFLRCFSAGHLEIESSGNLDLIATSYTLSSLPTSAGTTGTLYTQTASQLGGTGTTKVVCIA